jgi:hypothetical protein
MYTEKVESTSRLLTLADTCVGKIRARMRAHGIPIRHSSTTSNAVTLIPDINEGAIQGQLLRLRHLDCVLMRF